VQYETLPGWETDISSITKFEDLPENCRKYVKFIEDFVGVPVQVGSRSWQGYLIHRVC
jgi:adenylosuccinate synthase